MTAARVTIGLPVFNGEQFLGECLENITTGTCDEFVVRIFDNASTDMTGEIARAFADRDSRILYHRNPTNIGSAQNFLDALAAADTPYFLWRADDDLASPTFLNTMVSLLDANPQAALAAGHVISKRPSKARIKTRRFVEDWPAPRIVNILRKMFFAHPSWIYGLWRTDALRQYYHTTWERYPVGWANDHLVLLGAILDEAVVGSNDASFIQRIGVRSGAGPSQHIPIDAQIDEKRARLDRFAPLCRQAIDERDWRPTERWLLNAFVGNYIRKRVRASELEIMGLRLRRSMAGSFTSNKP